MVRSARLADPTGTKLIAFYILKSYIEISINPYHSRPWLLLLSTPATSAIQLTHCVSEERLCSLHNLLSIL